jgi:hypothetical protein
MGIVSERNALAPAIIKHFLDVHWVLQQKGA